MKTYSYYFRAIGGVLFALTITTAEEDSRELYELGEALGRGIGLPFIYFE